MAELDEKTALFAQEAIKAGYSREEINNVLQKRGMSIPPSLPQEVINAPGLVSEIPGLSPALTHGTTPLAEAIGETTQIPEKIRSPLSGLIGIAPDLAAGFGLAKATPAIASTVKDISSGIWGKLTAARDILAARSLPKIGAQIEAVEKASGARAPGLKEPLVKVGKTVEKARIEIDRAADNLTKKLSAKKLLEQKNKLSLILKKFTKNQNQKDNLGADAIAKASKVQEETVQRLNKKIPAREPLAKEYAAAAKRRDLVKAALKFGGGAAGLGAIGYIGKKITGK